MIILLHRTVDWYYMNVKKIKMKKVKCVYKSEFISDNNDDKFDDMHSLIQIPT